MMKYTVAIVIAGAVGTIVCGMYGWPWLGILNAFCLGFNLRTLLAELEAACQ